MIKEYIEALSDKEKIKILKDWKTFEDAGMIGECDLRSHANAVSILLKHDNVTTWMRDLSFECSMYFANKYIQNISS